MNRKAKVAVIAVFGLIALAVAVAPVPATHGGPHCYGFEATIVVNDGPDVRHSLPVGAM